MTAEALKSFEEARQHQLSRIQARKIRAQVHLARQSPVAAGTRWPFELLQNAVDPGPRCGRSSVTVALRCSATKVVFEHDGNPFEFDELAALLSGGSSKDYESEETTGRFGTGFLVTHVLSEQVRVRGLLSVGDGDIESFELRLNRGGDEEAILRDIQTSSKAISAAQRATNIGSHQTAIFEYQYGETGIKGAHVAGLGELMRALPYLYATRPALGRVELRNPDGETETWLPSESVDNVEIFGGFVTTRMITVEGTQPRKLHVYRFATAKDASAAAIIVVEQTPGGPRVCSLGPDAPRVFRDYPIRSSGFLPVNLVLDGKFEVDQERDALLMSDAIDKPLIEDALSAAVVAVRYAIDRKWEGAHWLSETKRPRAGFRTDSNEETEWWTDQLRGFANRLSIETLVECENEMLPAVSESGTEHATFVVPRLLGGSTNAETTFERLVPLVAAASGLRPPIGSLAADWTKIAEGWHSLGVQVELTCVADVAKSVRGDAKMIGELNVSGAVDVVERWLAVFIDTVGECWDARDGIDEAALKGLVPNQSGRLCSPGDLMRDTGVSERLKDICAGMGYDVREKLLTGAFEEVAQSLELRHLPSVLEESVRSEADEDKIIAEAVQRMDKMLPDTESCEGVPGPSRWACVELLDHLWQTKEMDAEPIATQVPLIASDQSGVRWSPRRRFMAPVCVWPESAQPFANAYPPNRVLDSMYGGSEARGIPDVSAPMGEWGIAFTEPITRDEFELRERRLAVLAPGVDTSGYHVPRVPMSQISLLSPELLFRAESDVGRARDLLGLVLCHVAPSDPAWKQRQTVRGRKKDEEEIELCIPEAVWLADLKVRAWVPVVVPVEDGEDEEQKMVASAATLQGLLHPPWLEGNNDAIQLLSEWFGFDQLELRLLGMAQESAGRQELRNSLAQLVECGGADPQVYLSLAEDVEARERRKRDVDRCRRLGLAIQDRIGDALRNHDLDVELVDKGFDFEVALRNDDVLHDTAKKLELGPYLVEVKATRTGQARLTPLQAETATMEQARYVLCVVDLREVSIEDLDGDGLPAYRVEELAKVVADVGARVAQTYGNVEVAKTSDVAIRNDSALRYEVPPEIWESDGISISDWVHSVRKILAQA